MAEVTLANDSRRSTISPAGSAFIRDHGAIVKTRCCFAEVASRRCDDGALGKDERAAGFERLPHILFAHERRAARSVNGDGVVPPPVAG